MTPMRPVLPGLDVTGIHVVQNQRTKPWKRKPVKCYDIVHPIHGVIAVLRSRKRAEEVVALALAGEISVDHWPTGHRYGPPVGSPPFSWDTGHLTTGAWDELI